MFGMRKIALLFSLSSMLILLAAPAVLGAITTPSGLMVTSADFSSIALAWTDNSNNEDGFCVQRWDPAAAAWTTVSPQLAKDVTAWTDTGLAQGTSYDYRVYAYAQTGNIIEYSGFSNSASGTTMAQVTLITPPAAPTNLMAVAASTSSVALYWADNASDETGFRVERQESGSGSWAQVANLTADTQTYTDIGLTAGSKYFYRVAAFNTAGDSGFSNTADATTQDAPPTPAAPATMVMKFFLGNTQYTVDGSVQSMDVAPIEQYSRILLPIRYVVQPMGITPAWDGISKVTIQNSSVTIELWLNQNTARVNGANVLIDPDHPNVMPVTVPPGRIMLPLRFVAENLGCNAVWDPTPPGSATITYPGVP